MKKIALVTAMLALGAAVFAQEAPAFDDPKATVCDLSALAGKAKTVRVVNATHESALEVAVSVYDAKKQQWLSYGTAKLGAITDAAIIPSALSGKLKSFSHVAVVPSPDKGFKVLAAKANGEVRIGVLSLEEPSEYATVMDVFALNGTFKNAVQLENQSAATNAGFDIYTQKDNSDTWFKVGTAYVKGKGDTCAVNVVTPDPAETYRYFAVIAHDGTDYAYSAKKANGALVITVQ